MIMNPFYPKAKGAKSALRYSLGTLLVAMFMLPLQTNAQCDGNYLLNEGVAFNWVDISGTGTLVASGDDVSSGPVALGHIFTFYDVPYTSLVAASNGYISTDPTDAGPDLSNDCPLPSAPSTGGGARIYPLHDDLIASVWYQYFPITPVPHPGGVTPPMGASIFQWNATHFGGCSTEEFQVVLFDNGDIMYQFNQTCEGGAGSTTGLQNEAITSGETYACNSAGSISAGKSLIYYYSAPDDSPNPPTIVCPTPGGNGYTVGAGVAAAWTDISGTGTIVASGDDTSSGAVALGAPFPVYGTTRTSLNASSNGYITTDLFDGGPDLSNDCPLPAVPSTPFGTTGDRFYPLHDDLISTVRYQYFAVSPYPNPDGAMGASIFQWDAVHFGGCGPEQFQAVLYDNGDVAYMYNTTCEGGAGATVGVQSGDLADGTTVACNTPGSVTNGSVAFLRAPAPAFTAMAGTCEAFVPFGDPADIVAIDACGGNNVYFYNDYNFTQDASDLYPVGTTTVTFYAFDLTTGLNSTCSVDVTVTTPDAAVSAPWNEAPLAPPVAPPFNMDPFATMNCAGFTVNSGNGSATPFKDQGYFVYQELCGNSSITAKVSDFIGGGGYAGIQIRESLASGSKKVELKTQLLNFIQREIRQNTNFPANQQQFPAIGSDMWMRITRTDYGFGGPDYFVAEFSANGTNWTPIVQTFILMSDCALVGVFSEDTNINSTSTGVFESVSVTGAPAPFSAPDLDVADMVETQTSDFNSLTVFPNPATDQLNVTINQFAGQRVTLRVMNAVGQEVATRQIDAVDYMTETFDVTSWASGIYYLSVYSNNQAVETKKFIVKARP